MEVYTKYHGENVLLVKVHLNYKMSHYSTMRKRIYETCVVMWIFLFFVLLIILTHICKEGLASIVGFMGLVAMSCIFVYLFPSFLVKFLLWWSIDFNFLTPSTTSANVPKVSVEKREKPFHFYGGTRKCIKKRQDHWLIAIAENQYIELPHFKISENDVELMKTAVCYLGVPEENVIILRNPTKAYFKTKLEQILKKLRSKAKKLYFYYSGHGILDTKGKFYFLPIDACVDTEKSLNETGISITEIEKMLSRIEGQKISIY